MTQFLPMVYLPMQFKVRSEAYWQSVAIYSLTLILYVVIKALWDTTLQTGIVNVVLTDPMVVLLGMFVLASVISLIATLVSNRSIVVSEAGIAFTSRFHERLFLLEEIEKISIGRERRVKVRGVLSLVKVRIKGRRRTLRIRPAIYENDQMLVSALLSLRNYQIHGVQQPQ